MNIEHVDRFIDSIDNWHTQRAYSRAIAAFLAWCQNAGARSIKQITPAHVASWIDDQSKIKSAASVGQELSALRRFFDFMIREGLVASNPVLTQRAMQ